MNRDTQSSAKLGIRGHSTAAAGTAPAVAPVDGCALYYEIDTDTLFASLNGGPWTALLTPGGGSGWTDLGTNVVLATITDTVGIGVVQGGAGSKVFISGTADVITLQVGPSSIPAQTADVVRVTNADGTQLHFRIYPTDGVDMGTAIRHSGDITPAALAGNVNDYNPAGLAQASVIRQNGSGAASRNVTGLAGGADGRVIDFLNISDVAAETIVLTHEDALSAATNRFHLPDLANVTIGRAASVRLWYDGTISRWRVVN